MTQPQVAAAQEAYATGLCVVPPREDGSKAPIGVWKQYQYERPDRAQMNTWYGGTNPARGIGVIVGRVSGHVEMVEMEGAAIAEGYYPKLLEHITEAGLEDVWLRIVTGYTESTPNGGFHCLLRTEAIADSQKLTTRPMTRPEFDASLNEAQVELFEAKPEKGEWAFRKATVLLAETKGEGGFTICAPTNGAVHPRGRAWNIVSGGFATIATVTCDERDALYEVFRSLTETRRTARTKSVKLTPTVTFDGEPPGDAYNADPQAHTNVVRLMERHGWTVSETVDGVTHMTRPGKEEGTSATIGYYGNPPMLHVFTSSSGDFDADETYSPFGVYAILEHAGNHSEAARQLRRDGYGETVASPLEARPVAEDEVTGEGVVYELPGDRELWLEDDGTGIPPKLDKRIYHGPIGDLLRFWEGRTEPLTQTIAVELFAGIAAHIGHNLYYEIPDEGRVWLNWWGLLIGDTSLSRKGTASGVAKRSMPPDFDVRETNGIGSGEKLLELVSNVERDDDGKIVGGHLDQRLLVDEPEFGAILIRSEQSGSTLSPTMRKLYDGTPVHHEVKAGSTHADSYHLCVAASITPGELRVKLSDVAISNGFANRFQMFAGLDSIDLPLPTGQFPHDELDRLRHRLGINITTAIKNGPEMRWSDEAAQAYARAYSILKRTKGSQTVRQILARSTDHLIKLTGIYAACDGETTMGVEHLMAAAAWVRYSNETARWVYSVTDADEWSRRILEVARARPGVPVNVSSEIHRQAFSHNRPSSGEVLARIDKLEAAGWLHKFTFKAKPLKAGRPAAYVVATKPVVEKA